MKRVLLVGFGRIGKEVFDDYLAAAQGAARFMVVDPAVPTPEGFEWDQKPVDVAVVMVDTPGTAGGTLDHTLLTSVVAEYLAWAEFVLVRSTVSLDFLGSDVYRQHAPRIGFCPEFYGVTRHNRRGQVELDFVVFSDNVPEWFAELVTDEEKLKPVVRLVAPAAEVIVAKLADNAYLATKVTFFHELALMCESLGLDFETVRHVVTSDVRVAPGHSYCDDGYGWGSHCFDKDVPAFAHLGPDTKLVRAAIFVNAKRLLPARQFQGVKP